MVVGRRITWSFLFQERLNFQAPGLSGDTAQSWWSWILFWGLVFSFSVVGSCDVFFLGRENGVKTGTCVACIYVLGAVPGHNIDTLTAVSHFSLRGHSFFLRVKAWVFLEYVSTAWVSGSISMQSNYLSAGLFHSVLLVTSSEILLYSCDGLQCRCTTCISQGVLKNCHSHVSLLSCSERSRWDVRIYQQGSCCHHSWMETARSPAHGITPYTVRRSLALISVSTRCFFYLLLVSLCMSLNLNH